MGDWLMQGWEEIALVTYDVHAMNNGAENVLITWALMCESTYLCCNSVTDRSQPHQCNIQSGLTGWITGCPR